MASKALVTGGTGFIGRRLVNLLLDKGWQVRAFVLKSERERLPQRENLESRVGDVTQPATLHGAMDDVDAVFHMAALVDSWIRHPREFFRVNVEGTRHMIDEALRAAVPRFLFTSSMSGIGVTPGAVMREDSPPGLVFGPYEASKADAERLVEQAARERGLPAITLIPSIVLGSGDTRNTGKFLLSFVNGEFPGTFAEETVLPVVDADDVARAHLAAYVRGHVGERYIISGQNVTWGELLRVASAKSGTPIPSRHIGGRTLWLVSRAGEIAARVTRAPPRLPAWLADLFLTGAAMDNTKSIRDLGVTYRPIAESIGLAIDWFREEGLFQETRPRPAMGLPGPVENPPVELPGVATQLELSDSARPEAVRDRRPKPPAGPT